MSVNEKMTTIADAIRDKTRGTDKLTLDAMATEIPKVYDAGQQAEKALLQPQIDALEAEKESLEKDLADAQAHKNAALNMCTKLSGNLTDIRDVVNQYGDFIPTGTQTGDYAEKVDEAIQHEHSVGVEAGKQAEYDAFWDVFQDKGARRIYSYAFYGTHSWKHENFKPKHPLYVSYGISMFASCVLENIDYDINFTQGIGETAANNIFSGASKLKKIKKLFVRSSLGFSGWFNNCTALEEITIEGTIAKNFDIRFSTKLTHDSLMSIINALKDYSADTSGTTYTLTIGGTNIAKLSTEERSQIESKGWYLA